VQPLVSIIINNYNYARYVGAAVDSALAQGYPRLEVIVIDDGSQDGSRELISAYGSRIKAVFKENGGQSSAFNLGFAQSHGDIVCFLDSDDVFMPEKVTRVVEILERSSEGWCFHHLLWADANLEPMPTPSIPFGTAHYDFRSDLIRGKCTFSPPATSGLAFTRRLLDRIMPIPDAIKITSDNYLKFAALALEPGYFIAEKLALQRIHGNNLYTGRKDATLRANVQIVTAVSLKARVPVLRSMCNRMFAEGIVNKWCAGATTGTVRDEIREYFADLSFTEKTETFARITYKAARQGVKMQLGATNEPRRGSLAGPGKNIQ
jgi:glycosyltransferase involved in cell wall biosynthesis